MSGDPTDPIAPIVVPVLTPPKQVLVVSAPAEARLDTPTAPPPTAPATPPTESSPPAAAADRASSEHTLRPAADASARPEASAVASPAGPSAARPAPRGAPPPLEPFELSSIFAPHTGPSPAVRPQPTPEAPESAVPPAEPPALPPSRFLAPPPPPTPPAIQESRFAASTPPPSPPTEAPILPRYGPPPAEPISSPSPSAPSPPLPADLEVERGPASAPAPIVAAPEPPPTARRLRWWARVPLRVGRAIVLLGMGIVCCLGWLVAIYANVAANLPHGFTLAAEVTLIVVPPVGITLACAVPDYGAAPRLALALAAVLLGALPALLLPPPGSLAPAWLEHAPLLVPGFSAGVAVGFGWPPPVDPAPSVTTWGVGMRAAGLAALGYCLPIFGLLAFQAVAALTFARPCPGPNCFTQVLTIAYLSLVGVFTAVFGSILVLVGGAFGALLRDR